jgi:signal peptidase I
LPGDTVRIERFVAFVRPSGESEFISEFAVTDRQYTLSDGPRPQGWRSTDPFGGATAEITLAPDQYFVLADNRAEGFDSRHWGPVSKSDIYGRLWVRFWPVNRVNAL